MSAWQAPNRGIANIPHLNAVCVAQQQVRRCAQRYAIFNDTCNLLGHNFINNASNHFLQMRSIKLYLDLQQEVAQAAGCSPPARSEHKTPFTCGTTFRKKSVTFSMYDFSLAHETTRHQAHLIVCGCTRRRSSDILDERFSFVLFLQPSKQKYDKNITKMADLPRPLKFPHPIPRTDPPQRPPEVVIQDLMRESCPTKTVVSGVMGAWHVLQPCDTCRVRVWWPHGRVLCELRANGPRNAWHACLHHTDADGQGDVFVHVEAHLQPRYYSSEELCARRRCLRGHGMPH